MWEGRCGHSQLSWQVLSCHTGQVRTDPGAGHAAPQTRGKCLTQACRWGQGTSLYLEPARVEPRGGVDLFGAGEMRI